MAMDLADAPTQLRTDSVLPVCVVGAGPRGISVLERLCANTGEMLDGAGVDATVRVELVDPFVGDGGRVWNRRQERMLLMNTVACQITLFVDDSVACDGPVVPGPALDEWAADVTAGRIDTDLPPPLRVEAAGIGANTYPSRALYGAYLHWALSVVIGRAGPRVEIRCRAAAAVDVQGSADGEQLVSLDDGTTLVVSAVVMVQGHVTVAEEPRPDLHAFAEAQHLRWVGPANPADVDLTDLTDDDTVLITGLGLCFFDHLALLTQGRGGSFERRPDGRLTYRASGREPHIVAGSRRGLPYHARGENQKGASRRHDPMFLTAEVVDGLRRRSREIRPLDFRTEIWPLLDAEVRLAHARAVTAQRLGPDCADRLHDEYRRLLLRELAGETVDDDDLLARYAIAPSQRWSWRQIVRPYRAAHPVDHEDHRRWLRDYLADDVRHARRGNVIDPLKTAVDVLRDLRNELRLLIDHCGVDGDSYRRDLLGWYMPVNAFLSIGPPPERVEQLVALLDAGVVDVLGPDVRVAADEQSGRLAAWSAAYPDHTCRPTWVIEARIPASDIRRTRDRLLRTLLDRRACMTYKIPTTDRGAFDGGGLAVTPKPYNVLDDRQHPNPRWFAFGIPTETVHWMTAAGIRPGVNSVILGDADAVARECLRVGLQDLDEGRDTSEGVER